MEHIQLHSVECSPYQPLVVLYLYIFWCSLTAKLDRPQTSQTKFDWYVVPTLDLACPLPPTLNTALASTVARVFQYVWKCVDILPLSFLLNWTLLAGNIAWVLLTSFCMNAWSFPSIIITSNNFFELRYVLISGCVRLFSWRRFYKMENHQVEIWWPTFRDLTCSRCLFPDLPKIKCNRVGIRV